MPLDIPAMNLCVQSNPKIGGGEAIVPGWLVN